MTWNVRNILTFGADGHVRAACEEYARPVARLTEAEALAQNGRAEAAKALNRLLDEEARGGGVRCHTRTLEAALLAKGHRRPTRSASPTRGRAGL